MERPEEEPLEKSVALHAGEEKGLSGSVGSGVVQRRQFPLYFLHLLRCHLSLPPTSPLQPATRRWIAPAKENRRLDPEQMTETAKFKVRPAGRVRIYFKSFWHEEWKPGWAHILLFF